jgi:hypothetical protein
MPDKDYNIMECKENEKLVKENRKLRKYQELVLNLHKNGIIYYNY